MVCIFWGHHTRKDGLSAYGLHFLGTPYTLGEGEFLSAGTSKSFEYLPTFPMFVSSKSNIRNMAKIYVASSWRNQFYSEVVKALRSAGHEVYDFRNPPHGGSGFHWTDIDENAPAWNFGQYAAGLHHPLAEKQFSADLDALKWADTCVLVLPCGRSAHTEAGWMAGAGKKVVVYIPEMVEPELMYKLFDGVVGTISDLIGAVENARISV